MDTTPVGESLDWPVVPQAMQDRLDRGDRNVGIWKIRDPRELIAARNIIRKDFPDRNLAPFALTNEVSHMSCFDLDTGKISVIDFELRPGGEQQETFDTFLDWETAALFPGSGLDDDG